MIQSVERAFFLLERLADAGEAGLSLGELCRRSGLKPPTARNLMNTLLALGYASQEAAGRRYRQGPKFQALGSPEFAARMLARAGEVPVARLHEAVNETVVLAMDDRGRRRTVLARESDRILKVGASAGTDVRFADTATGRVLLALGAVPASEGAPARLAEGPLVDDIRRTGYAALEKPRDHIVALAVPVVPTGCSIRASLGVYYPANRDSAERRTVLLEALREAARTICVEWERI